MDAKERRSPAHLSQYAWLAATPSAGTQQRPQKRQRGDDTANDVDVLDIRRFIALGVFNFLLFICTVYVLRRNLARTVKCQYDCSREPQRH